MYDKLRQGKAIKVIHKNSSSHERGTQSPEIVTSELITGHDSLLDFSVSHSSHRLSSLPFHFEANICFSKQSHTITNIPWHQNSP